MIIDLFRDLIKRQCQLICNAIFYLVIFFFNFFVQKILLNQTNETRIHQHLLGVKGVGALKSVGKVGIVVHKLPTIDLLSLMIIQKITLFCMIFILHMALAIFKFDKNSAFF